MSDFFKKIANIFLDDSNKETPQQRNASLISAYRTIKRAIPDFDEPNYSLAREVFHDFNEFNLKNIELIKNYYVSYNIPQSLLPYPKNYIKCAYYIYLEDLKRKGEDKLVSAAENVAVSLFFGYPDYKNYKKGLKRLEEAMTAKKWGLDEDEWARDELKKSLDNAVKAFKDMYGVYEISETDYYESLSSTDASEDKIIHDFGFLPKIEPDVTFDEARSWIKKK
jgi:hypothetical protein